MLHYLPIARDAAIVVFVASTLVINIAGYIRVKLYQNSVKRGKKK